MLRNMKKLYIDLSSTFNNVSSVTRTGVVVSYWLIDSALTNQRYCISLEKPMHFITSNRHLFLQKIISEFKYFSLSSGQP